MSIKDKLVIYRDSEKKNALNIAAAIAASKRDDVLTTAPRR